MSSFALPADPLFWAAVLGGLALVLVGPAPLWVARWRFLYRVPRAAVVLWQAGTLAALVSVIGAAVAVAALGGGGDHARPRFMGRDP